ncbi:MAG: Ppx/GppA family phosphatase [Candidatus Cloacimonetes bacterium]|nr:Ppx/GppA family phosphatase [Candidatus Cloacimonadota bacterium]
MARYAVLDIGTNSMKYLLAEHSPEGLEILRDELNITRLGESLQETGQIPFMVMERNLNAIREFKQISDEYQVDEFILFSTAVLRRAENADAFVGLVRKELNLSIRILSEEEEAELAYEAVTDRLQEKSLIYMIFDIGGGSTEFIISSQGEVIDKISLPVGALVMTDRFIKTDPPTQEEIKTADAYLQTVLQKHFTYKEVDTILTIGGTVTTLAAVKIGLQEYDAHSIDGLNLTINDVKSMINYFAGLDLESRMKVQGLHPQRADIILAGTLIVKAIMEVTSKDIITVCDCGIRHGMMNSIVRRNSEIT